LKQQTNQDYEVIVVTNGCTDTTEETVKKRLGKNLRHFSMPKANVSRARNHGASKANGDILLFLDADTTLAKDSLQVIKKEFTSQYSVGTTKVLPDDTAVKFRIAMAFKNVHNRTGFYKGCSGALICRKESFDKVYGYNPEISVKEHKQLTHKLLTKGKYICVNAYATTSMRRLSQWGLLKSSSFWIQQWVKGKIKGVKDTTYELVR
jgi:glycosyltransferase involved in cell wall biosynthesis